MSNQVAADPVDRWGVPRYAPFSALFVYLDIADPGSPPTQTRPAALEQAGEGEAAAGA